MFNKNYISIICSGLAFIIVHFVLATVLLWLLNLNNNTISADFTIASTILLLFSSMMLWSYSISITYHLKKVPNVIKVELFKQIEISSLWIWLLVMVLFLSYLSSNNISFMRLNKCKQFLFYVSLFADKFACNSVCKVILQKT